MAKTVREQVLDALLKADRFISGEVLSEELSVSRTSVWKAIKKLKEEGYRIESVNNKGYRMIEESNELSESRFIHELSPLGFDYVKLYETIDSTNVEAKRKADIVESNGLFIAKEQTLGKGRRGREWHSPHGSGIYFSMLIRPNIEPNNASMLTLAAGISVCETINALFHLNSAIKWPNDIVSDGRKLCGILTEMSAEIGYTNYVVIGIGINMKQRKFPSELEDKATSLLIERDKSARLDEIPDGEYQLIAGTVDRFINYAKQIEKDGNLQKLVPAYEALCVNVNQKVRVESGKEEFTGQGLGITPEGQLLVKDEFGEVVKLYSGEVSVRGIYGYV